VVRITYAQSYIWAKSSVALNLIAAIGFNKGFHSHRGDVFGTLS